MPTFSLWWVPWAAALGELGIPHGQQQFQIILLAPHQDGTQQGRRCSHSIGLGRPLGRFPVGLARRLASPVFRWVFWTHGRTNVAGISRFVEVGRHSELCEFHSCALCHEVSHHWLFTKIPSLPLTPEIILFRSLPKIQDHWEGSERRPIQKTDSFAVFETSRFATTDR